MLKKLWLKLNKNDFSLMDRQMQFMVGRVIILLFKDIFGIPKNYLDKEIYYMLDEYSYYYDYSKDWKKRYK